MNLEKIKRKIAEGYCDEAITNMSGMPVEEVAKLRAPAPKPQVKVEAPKAVAPKAKKPAIVKPTVGTTTKK